LPDALYSRVLPFRETPEETAVTAASSSPRESQVAVVESFLDCIVKKDLDRIPIAPDYCTESPLAGRLTGQAALDYLRIVARAVEAIRIEQHIVEGDRVATLFEEDTAGGTLPVFSCFRIEHGRIKESRVFYDSRRIDGRAGSGGR
jgi:hypothetical protein